MTSAAPAPAELDERAPITADQVAAFERDGFIRIPSAISPDVLAVYEPEISRLLFDLNTMHLPLEERSTYNKAFLQVTNLARHSETVRRFVLGARLGGIAADLLGVERVRLYSDQALYKESGGGITPWHADQYYWPLSSDRAVTVWIPLQDTPAELGPLEFARGSHAIDLGRDIGISDHSEESVNAALEEAGLEVDSSPYALGDVSYHLGWTFHRASPNRSDKPRRVMTVIYVDADIRATEPHHPAHEASLEITMAGTEPGNIPDTPVNPLIPQPTEPARNPA